jgi:hypothetical protein
MTRKREEGWSGVAAAAAGGQRRTPRSSSRDEIRAAIARG